MTTTAPAAAYDAIVVGGGHNGLVAGFYLARAGKRVAIFERRPVVGGPSSTHEWFPGYRHSFSNSPGGLEPLVAADMELERLGLRYNRPDPSVVLPFADGRIFAGRRDKADMLAELRKYSARDAESYYTIVDRLNDFARRLGVSFFEPPPTLARLMSRLSTSQDEDDFQKYVLGSVKDLLDEWFETDEIKAVLASVAVGSVFAGPRTPGTAFGLLRRSISLSSAQQLEVDDPRLQVLRGSTGLPVGGMGAITEAMRRSVESRGGSIFTDSAVAELIVKDGAVRGIVLAGGNEVHAPVVLSNLNPKTTFLDLVPAKDLEPEFRARVAAIPMHGSQFKIMLALSGVPRWAGVRDDAEALRLAACQFRVTPSIDYMERAWDDLKYGRSSREPMFWGLIPSVLDPECAPPGRHLMSLNIYHAPYKLASGDWETERDVFGKRCIEVLSRHMPNLPELIVDHAFWSPRDFEREFGLVESNIMHGDMLPQRLLLRPLAGYTDYRTPIRGLYLCGSGSWPGGTVTGIPGHNGSHEALKDLEGYKNPVR